MRQKIVKALFTGLIATILSTGSVQGDDGQDKDAPPKPLSQRMALQFEEGVYDELQNTDIRDEYLRQARFQLHLDNIFQSTGTEYFHSSELYRRASKHIFEHAGSDAILESIPYLQRKIGKLESYKEKVIEKHASIEKAGWSFSGDILCGEGIVGGRIKKAFSDGSELRFEACGDTAWTTYPVEWRPKWLNSNFMKDSRFGVFAGYDHGVVLGLSFSLTGDNLVSRPNTASRGNDL